jgi:hypothetical protein
LAKSLPVGTAAAIDDLKNLLLVTLSGAAKVLGNLKIENLYAMTAPVSRASDLGWLR